MEPPTQICTCSLVEAGKSLQTYIDKLEKMIPNAENPKAIAMIQKELRAAMKEWDTLYQKHITEYRRSFQLQMIQYAKVRAINSDLVAGKDPLKTSLMTTATIREARKPVTRKQKKDKQPTERKRKK